MQDEARRLPRAQSGPAASPGRETVYAALDLGTNNCRLLIARPDVTGFHVIDAFSRIVRLGEGLSGSGRLGEEAIGRTLDALAVCVQKMRASGVARARLVATEACRAAENGAAFLARVRVVTGLDLEVIERGDEAALATAGCAALADAAAAGVVVFDIGGGSSEIVWLAPSSSKSETRARDGRILAWTSLRLGVVTLSERFGGRDVTPALFEAMVDTTTQELAEFRRRTAGFPRCDRFHLLGTSGTVTTIAAVHLGLARYTRHKVDGLWMDDAEVATTIDRLLAMSYAERAANGCIGPGRADLVLAGCAILVALQRSFPSARVRIADRGLREGLLTGMMEEDGVWRGAA